MLLEVESRSERPVHVEALDELPSWVQPRWHTLRAWRDGERRAALGRRPPPPICVGAIVRAPPPCVGSSIARARPLSRVPRVVCGRGTCAGELVPLNSALGAWSLRPSSVRADQFGTDDDDDDGEAAAAAGEGPEGGAHVLSWSATLAAGSSLVVGLDFVKSLRHVDAVPPDASRGLDVGSAAIGFAAAADGERRARRSGAEPATTAAGAADAPLTLLYTAALLVPVPIADDTMSFNVIAISSTLVALFVGSMFGLLTRPPQRAGEGPSAGARGGAKEE